MTANLARVSSTARADCPFSAPLFFGSLPQLSAVFPSQVDARGAAVGWPCGRGLGSCSSTMAPARCSRRLPHVERGGRLLLRQR